MLTTTTTKSTTYKFTGKCAWAQVYEPDEYRGSSNWKIDLYLDEENLALFKKSGIQGKLKTDENGTFAKFKRPTTKLIKGAQQIFSGPRILDADGKVLVEYKKNDTNTGFDRVGDPILIGNGSIVELTVTVYPTTMGPGNRLESIRILDLIEYTGGGGDRNDSITVAAPAATGVKAPW